MCVTLFFNKIFSIMSVSLLWESKLTMWMWWQPIFFLILTKFLKYTKKKCTIQKCTIETYNLHSITNSLPCVFFLWHINPCLSSLQPSIHLFIHLICRCFSMKSSARVQYWSTNYVYFFFICNIEYLCTTCLLSLIKAHQRELHACLFSSLVYP